MKQKIKNRKINEDGSIILDSKAIFESLFINPKIIENIIAEDTQEIQEYNKWAKIYDLPIINTKLSSIDHFQNQQQWSMPDFYKSLDIEKYLLSVCENQSQVDRVIKELKEFKDRNLYNLLRYMAYLVAQMRKNNIVWGVGRGSSVSSYCLFLLGVHKVDSLRYDLDIKEFLK